MLNSSLQISLRRRNRWLPVCDDPEVGECAGGDDVLFKQVITEVVESLLFPISSAFITLGSLLAPTLMGTCVVHYANQDQCFENLNTIPNGTISLGDILFIVREMSGKCLPNSARGSLNTSRKENPDFLSAKLLLAVAEKLF